MIYKKGIFCKVWIIRSKKRNSFNMETQEKPLTKKVLKLPGSLGKKKFFPLERNIRKPGGNSF